MTPDLTTATGTSTQLAPRRPTGRILAIDPGNVESAWVVYDCDSGRLVNHAKQSNDIVIVGVYAWSIESEDCPTACVIERIASYGMAVGREVFETCEWVGRFCEAWRRRRNYDPHTLYRRQVKLHLCNSPRANDSNIRQRLIDIYGGKEKAIGRKAAPGPLYGISKDRWAALALAVTFADGVTGVPQ